jgi:hypothetical protein
VRVGHILLADGADYVAEEGLDGGMGGGDGAADGGDVSAVGAVIDVEVELARADHLREAGEDTDVYVHVVSVASD